MSHIHSYQCLGLISGSSLDGLDIAHMELSIQPDAINPVQRWNLIEGRTIEYPNKLRQKLEALPEATARTFVEVDDELGLFFADAIVAFLQNTRVDYISSHGHTVYHHPGLSSTQIGNPAIIAAKTNTLTISDLRNMDTAYGGQGAPLAPMADLYLFPEYDVCVNLGGIANISIKNGNHIEGYDVCGANQFLNYLSERLSLPYDDGGMIARSGSVDAQLLEKLNQIPYCQLAPPKSLDNRQVQSYYLPIIDNSASNTRDILATIVEHIAIQLSKCIPTTCQKVMIAGGGAHNTYLIERIGSYLSDHTEIVIPDASIINFKEALLTGMCGGLRLHKLPNALKSFTGASKNTINGVVFQP